MVETGPAVAEISCFIGTPVGGIDSYGEGPFEDLGLEGRTATDGFVSCVIVGS